MLKLKIKFKLNLQRVSYYFYFLIAIATIVALILVSLFLYRNFYTTITQSEAVLILQEKVAPEAVNMNNFNKVIGKIKKKTEKRELGKLKNLFD